MKKTNLNVLLSFPSLFTYKVIGLAKPELVNQVIEVARRHVQVNYHPEVKASKQGSYYSISITIYADDIQQVEVIYEELSNLDIVLMVL